MSRQRKHIPFKTKLVAALCQMRYEVDGRWELILSSKDAQALSEDQILSLFHWDHSVIPHAEDGPDAHWNLAPELIVPHREKSAKVDVPGIAKRKSVRKKFEELTRTLATPRDQRKPKVSRWGSRPFQKREKRR